MVDAGPATQRRPAATRPVASQTAIVSCREQADTPKRMEIPKDKVLELIRERVGGQQADQAANELPDQVDPERHSDLLAKIGLNPQDLLSGGLGGLGGKLGL